MGLTKVAERKENEGTNKAEKRRETQNKIKKSRERVWKLKTGEGRGHEPVKSAFIKL